MAQLSPADVDRLRRDFKLLQYIQRTGVKLRERGDAWRGECPICGGGSKSVFVVWPGNGRCKCWRCDLGGDAIDVVMRLERLDFGGALEFMGAGELPELSAEARQVRENEERAREDERRREAAKKRKAGRVVWDASSPNAGTPAEAYLVGRGLSGPFPPTLRFNPKVHCSYTDEAGDDHKRKLPALIAGVQGPSGDVLTVHRIYLDVLDDGSAVKARGIPAEDVKKLHGPPGAGAVRLTPWAPALVLAEGIETALAVCQSSRPAIEAGKVAVWAAISAGQLLCIEFAEGKRPDRVLIIADHDRWKWNRRLKLWVPPAGQTKAQAACERFRRMGIPSAWRAPIEPGDWLDVMLGAVPPGHTDRIPPEPAEIPEPDKAADEAADDPARQQGTARHD